jgi:hypothetical protein
MKDFTCHAVKISKISKHPNADNLDVVNIDGFPGNVVTTHGEWLAGDVAVLIGENAVVPVHSPYFEYLQDRLDYNSYGSYRIKACNIKGVKSYGILVKCPVNNVLLGEFLGYELGVTRYVSKKEMDSYVLETAPYRIESIARFLLDRFSCERNSPKNARYRSNLKSIIKLARCVGNFVHHQD